MKSTTLLKKNKLFCKQNIPNMLVIFRMVIAIAVVVLVLLNCYGTTGGTIYTMKDPLNKVGDTYAPYCNITLMILLAGILFVIASITDWLDGFLARKYNWISDFGKFWDPVADKVLINATLICFGISNFIPIWIPIIMITRDVIVDADRMVAAKNNIVVAANIYGKLKTVLQMVGIILIFFIWNGDYVNGEGHIAMWWGVQNLLMYAACAMSIFSGVFYMVNISRAKKNLKAKVHE